MESPIFKNIEQEVEGLSQSQILDLASRLIEIARVKGAQVQSPIDWSKYKGVLKHGPDPLEYQHRIRAEWNDHP